MPNLDAAVDEVLLKRLQKKDQLPSEWQNGKNLALWWQFFYFSTWHVHQYIKLVCVCAACMYMCTVLCNVCLCMYVYVCLLCAYVCLYVYVCICLLYVHVYIVFVCMRCVCLYVSVVWYVCMHVCLYVYVCLYVCMCVRKSVRVCVCVYVFVCNGAKATALLSAIHNDPTKAPLSVYALFLSPSISIPVRVVVSNALAVSSFFKLFSYIF